MADEYYTFTALSFLGIAIVLVMFGAVLMLVAMMIAAGVKAERRDRARIRSWSRDVGRVQDDELARRRRKRDRATLRPFAKPKGVA